MSRGMVRLATLVVVLYVVSAAAFFLGHEPVLGAVELSVAGLWFVVRTMWAEP